MRNQLGSACTAIAGLSPALASTTRAAVTTRPSGSVADQASVALSNRGRSVPSRIATGSPGSPAGGAAPISR